MLKPDRESERIDVTIVIIKIYIRTIIYPGVSESGSEILIDVSVNGEIVCVLFIPPAVIEEEIVIIIFLLVVLQVCVDDGLTQKGKAQACQDFIPVIVPVAPIGGIIVIEVTHPEEPPVIKEEKILCYSHQIIDSIPVGGMMKIVVVKILILEPVLYLGEKF